MFKLPCGPIGPTSPFSPFGPVCDKNEKRRSKEKKKKRNENENGKRKWKTHETIKKKRIQFQPVKGRYKNQDTLISTYMWA